MRQSRQARLHPGFERSDDSSECSGSPGERPGVWDSGRNPQTPASDGGIPDAPSASPLGSAETRSSRHQGFANAIPIERDPTDGTLESPKGPVAHNEEMTSEKIIVAKVRAACLSALKAEALASEKRQRLVEGIEKLVNELLAPKAKAPILFSEPELPKGTPGRQLWATHRKDRESPAAFIHRVYGPDGADWLDAGMSMRQLRARDRILVTEFYRWRKTHALPVELKDKLPTVKQRNERLLSTYAQVHRRNGAQRPIARELSRIQAAAHRAAQRNSR